MKLTPSGVGHINPLHIATALARRAAAAAGRQRVVILGSGWAGYELAHRLDPRKYERILVSPRSYFVFTPLLASTSVGTLEFRSVIEPVRRLGLDTFHQGWADHVDFGRKVIHVEANASDDLSSGGGGATARVGGETPLLLSSNLSVAPAQPGGDGPVLAPGPQLVPKGAMYEVEYDKLVVAVGAYSQTFSIEGVREHANFLRDVTDARKIRLKVLQCLEKAALPTTSDELRRRLLHFVIVGGGPTGIEFAAELHDLLREDLSVLYPSLMRHVVITVYDVAPKVLPMFDQALASYATELFQRQGITVKTEHHLQSIRSLGDGSLALRVREKKGEDKDVGAGVVVWSTGLTQNPLVNKLLRSDISPAAVGTAGPLAPDSMQIRSHERSGAIITDDNLRIQVSPSSSVDVGKAAQNGLSDSSFSLPDVFAIGDCSSVTGQNLPATAQVASQQAKYLAKKLNNSAADNDATAGSTPFQFRNWGTMAYLGSWRAIHQNGNDELKGRAAWMLWRTAYLTKSMSLRNKIMVPIYWFMTWLFGRDISRF